MKKFFLFIIIFNLIQIKAKNNNLKNEKLIFIFIHGAQDIKKLLMNPYINPYFFYKNVQDIINNRNIENLLKITDKKNKPNTSYKDIATSYEGLYKINEENILSEGAKFLLDTFIKILKKNCNFKNYEYYAFGWSGITSDSERIRAGKILYNELKNIHEQNINKKYKICLIGNSYGGNICLEIPNNIKNNEKFKKIDFLFTIGCPLEENLKKNINKKYNEKFIFKNFFNIYSEVDMVQNYVYKITCKNKSSSPVFIKTSRKNYFEISYLFVKKLNNNNLSYLNNNKNPFNAFISNMFSKNIHYPTHGEMIRFIFYKNKIYPPAILIVPFILNLTLNKKFKNINKKIKLFFNEKNNILYFAEYIENKINIFIKKFIENDFIQNYRKNAKKIDKIYY